MVCPVARCTDEQWIAWPCVVDVCGLRVIHERFVVRDVVTSVYDRVVAGESGVMLAAYGTTLSVHTRRREATLEPTPRDALGIQQVAHVLTRHRDLADVLELVICRHAIVKQRPR